LHVRGDDIATDLIDALLDEFDAGAWDLQTSEMFEVESRPQESPGMEGVR
jgi:hypothetical protein